MLKNRGDTMERDQLFYLFQKVIRARKLELDLSDLHDKELKLQKEIEKLEPLIKPKRKFFGFGKKDSNDYEISQAKERYNIAVQELSYIQDSISGKSNELSSLQEAKEKFYKIYENKLAMIKLSNEHKEKLQILKNAYLTSMRRKELLPEANKKAWRVQYQIQNILLILRQALEAYDADAKGNALLPYSKFERLDKAKEETEKLEKMLQELQTLLNEMDLKFDMNIELKNFVSYASEGNESFWVDSRILTLQVRERIKNTILNFEQKELHTDHFRKELIMMKNNSLNDLYEKQNRLEEFVIHSI